jgi:D-alanyl-D-alanine carboxypeptidase
MMSLFLGLFLISSSLQASETLNANFARLLRGHRISPLSEQSYCYLENGKILGHNVQKKQRIASLTKLLTTLLAVKKADLNMRFHTKIYVSDRKIHIAGALDPYWEEDKLLLLLQALNEQGIDEVDELSFDSNFLFTDLAFGSHADITPVHTADRLSHLLSNAGRKTVSQLWENVRDFASEEGIDLRTNPPRFFARKIRVTKTNPLENSNPLVFEHVSKTLGEILKSMNVMSKNHVSQNIFRWLTAEESFEVFMVNLGFKSSDFTVNNGSGLPTLSLARQDNEATCSLILRSLNLLEEEIQKKGYVPSDILAVVGSPDLGSFRYRFRSSSWLNSGLMAKTGTLRHTSSLAGYLSLESLKPFAILNHTSSTQSAKNFQEAFVESLFTELGNPISIPYEKISIFPWDGQSFLQPLL